MAEFRSYWALQSFTRLTSRSQKYAFSFPWFAIFIKMLFSSSCFSFVLLLSLQKVFLHLLPFCSFWRGSCEYSFLHKFEIEDWCARQMLMDQKLTDQILTDGTSTYQMSTGQMLTDLMSSDQKSTNHLSWDKMASTKMSIEFFITRLT